MIFSNDEDCLYLTKEARRYLIIAIKHSQDAINEKLDAGVKDKILDALEFGSKELGHLLHHFQNVKIMILKHSKEMHLRLRTSLI